MSGKWGPLILIGLLLAGAGCQRGGPSYPAVEAQQYKERGILEEAGKMDRITPLVRPHTDRQRELIRQYPFEEVERLLKEKDKRISELETQNSEAKKEQIRMVNYIGGAVLLLFTLGLIFSQGRSLAGTWFLLPLSGVLFLGAQILAHPWFLPVGVGVLILSGVGVGIRELSKHRERKALGKIVAELDKCNDTEQLKANLSRVMDEAEKEVIRKCKG